MTMVHNQLVNLKLELMQFVVEMNNLKWKANGQSMGALNIARELEQALKYQPPVNPYDGLEHVRPCSHLLADVRTGMSYLEIELKELAGCLNRLEEMLDKKADDGQD